MEQINRDLIVISCFHSDCEVRERLRFLLGGSSIFGFRFQ